MSRLSVRTQGSVLALAALTLFAGPAFAQSKITGTDPTPQITGTDPTPQASGRITGTDPTPQITGTDPTPQMFSLNTVAVAALGVLLLA